MWWYRRLGYEGNKKPKVEVRTNKYRQLVPQNLGRNGHRLFHQAAESAATHNIRSLPAEVTLVTGLRLILGSH